MFEMKAIRKYKLSLVFHVFQVYFGSFWKNSVSIVRNFFYVVDLYLETFLEVEIASISIQFDGLIKDIDPWV